MRFPTSAYRLFRSFTSIGRLHWRRFDAAGSRPAPLSRVEDRDRKLLLPRPSRADLSSGGYERADRLARNRTLDVARRSEIEDDDRQAIVHAQRDGGGIH